MLLQFEGDDGIFLSNPDWDPVYLYELFKEDFFEFGNMAIGDSYSHITDDVTDSELVKAVESCEKEIHCPDVEDISMDDSELCLAVDQIEKE